MGQTSRSDEGGDVENQDVPVLGKRRSWLVGKGLLIKGGYWSVFGSTEGRMTRNHNSEGGRREASE